MVFWGCEVKPGKMVQEVPPPPGYTLHVTQATLGQNPKDGERTVVKCRTPDKEWIYLCSLTGGATESCQLDLMFEGEVTFAISGKTSVHLVGYLMPSHDHDHDDEDDEYELDYSDEDEDEEDDMDEDEDEDSEDESDDMEIPKRKSGVVIEEVEDELEKTEEKKDAKAANGSVKRENGEKAKKGKAPAAVKEEEEKDSEGEESEDEESEDEEDEDGFMAAKKRPAKKAAAGDSTEAKRQAVAGKEADKPTAAAAVPAKTPPPAAKGGAKVEAAAVKATPGKTPAKGDAAAAKGGAKTPGGEAKTPGGEAKTPGGGEAKTPGGGEAKKDPAKDRLFVKTFPNGFKIETVALGRPDAKAAKPGSRVFVKYVGRFRSNDKIFDQSKGPFSFRLGVGEVIKGWDVGLQGMRVGDKRKLTVPPAMGYGVKGAPPQIPGNSWLLFDVELCDVK